MKLKDLLWLLCYPIYQIIGTIRHEGSHALIGYLQGAKIKEFVFLPTFYRWKVLWGYVWLSGGNTTWLMTAAPYICDFTFFTICFIFLWKYNITQRWIYVNIVIIGLLSPLINTAYNYSNFSIRGDINGLTKYFQSNWFHIILIALLLYYISGIVFIIKKKNKIDLTRSMQPTQKTGG
jgi:hypothetical protein